MATKTLLTVEDYMRLPESVGTRDVRYELVEGEVVVVSPGMFPHNIVRDNVLVALRAFLPGKKLGTAVSEQGFQLSENTVRVPDVAFVRRGRKVAAKRPIEGAPDLAIEVVSPSNTPRELEQRISDYFAAGCKRVWVIHPDDREIYIHGLAGVTRRRGDELLEDAELLPGFSIKASSLFEKPEEIDEEQ